MADESMKKDFIDGVNEVYATMFTDGVNDGVYLYQFVAPLKKSVYKEQKGKQYSKPVLLVAKVQLTPQVGEQNVHTIKEKATITIPFKSLRDNDISVDNDNLVELRKGVLKYKDTFYAIDNITPKVFVADTFMAYQFDCTEELYTEINVMEDIVEEPPIESETQEGVEE